MSATENLVVSGILNLKLYFMVGLPSETNEDIESIVLLCRKIKQVFLASSRIRKRMGTITVSINPFVPKPFTPFQYAPMEEISLLKNKIEKIKKDLKKEANILIHAENPRNSFIQALLSRGDRTVSEILIYLNQNQNNWAKTLKQIMVNADFYVRRERSFDELLPWQYIDHGFEEGLLNSEFFKALKT